MIEKGSKATKIIKDRHSYIAVRSGTNQLPFNEEEQLVRTGGKQCNKPIDYHTRIKRGSMHRNQIL